MSRSGSRCLWACPGACGRVHVPVDGAVSRYRVPGSVPVPRRVLFPCPGAASQGLSLSRGVSRSRSRVPSPFPCPGACPVAVAVAGACRGAVGGPRRGRHGAERGPGAPSRLRVLRCPERPLGLLRLERGARAAPARHGCGRRALGCAGALGPNHACDVPAGLLEDLVKRAEVLPVRRDPLLCPLRAGLLRLPGPGHHPAPVPDRPPELLPVLRLELHGAQVGAAAEPLLAPLPRRVRRHQHPQRLLSRGLR